MADLYLNARSGRSSGSQSESAHWTCHLCDDGIWREGGDASLDMHYESVHRGQTFKGDRQLRAPQRIREVSSVSHTKGTDMDNGVNNQLLRDAVTLVVFTQFGSTAMLQRRLRTGFHRAGLLMDELERQGVVGEHNPDGARDVLVRQDDLDSVLNELG